MPNNATKIENISYDLPDLVEVKQNSRSFRLLSEDLHNQMPGYAIIHSSRLRGLSSCNSLLYSSCCLSNAKHTQFRTMHLVLQECYH